MSLQKLHAFSRSVADVLYANPDTRHDAIRIRNCYHAVAHPGATAESRYCHSPFCILCNQLRKKQESKLLALSLQNGQSIYPTSRLFFGTFTLNDCPTDQLHRAAHTLVDGWRNLCDTPAMRHAIGCAAAVEVISSNYAPELEHPHLHVAVAMKPGYSGRNYLTQERWQDLWQDSAGREAQSALVKLWRASANDLARYVIKSDVSRVIAEHGRTLEPERVADRLLQLHGTPVFHWQGAFLNSNTAPAADDPLYDLLYSSPRQWREFTRQYAMMPDALTPIPIEAVH